MATIDIDYDAIKKETEEAILFEIYEGFDVWLPKVAIKEHDEESRIFTISESAAILKKTLAK